MGQRRIKNISISKPILYGNWAEKVSEKNPLPAGAPPDHTHLWTLFVKDATGNDISQYVKKVVFKLHETYPNSTRTLEEPPFQITETGWGEFEVVIKIFFNNACGEKNVTLYHNIKLHPYPQNGEVKVELPGTRVESILYDEIVFNEPTEAMFKLLTSKPGSLLPYKSDKTVFTKENERDEEDRVDKAVEKVREMIEREKAEFQEMQEDKEALVRS